MNTCQPDKSRVYPNAYIHVPYWRFKEYEPLFREHSAGIELFIGSHTIDDVTIEGLREIRRVLGSDRPFSLHGPFNDLSPGAVDSLIASASLRRYLQTVSFAGEIGAGQVVFHSGYDGRRYGRKSEPWLTNSLKTWRRVLDEAEKFGIRIAIENVYDESPGHLVALAGEVGHELFGLCLDVGHREIYSELTVVEWVEDLHPYIFEVHLHDNHGKDDEHLPVGDGVVDFKALFGIFAELCVEPVLTVEALSPQDARTSLGRIGMFVR